MGVSSGQARPRQARPGQARRAGQVRAQGRAGQGAGQGAGRRAGPGQGQGQGQGGQSMQGQGRAGKGGVAKRSRPLAKSLLRLDQMFPNFLNCSAGSRRLSAAATSRIPESRTNKNKYVVVKLSLSQTKEKFARGGRPSGSFRHYFYCEWDARFFPMIEG